MASLSKNTDEKEKKKYTDNNKAFCVTSKRNKKRFLPFFIKSRLVSFSMLYVMTFAEQGQRSINE